MRRMNIIMLTFIIIAFWFASNYAEDNGSIFDTGSERIGYYQKQGNRIDIFDRSWERKGYVILNDRGQDYYGQGFERINTDTLEKRLSK